MATFNATQMANLLSTPIVYPDVGDVGGRLRVFNEKITMASQASGDIIRCGKLPKGARLLFGILVTSATLGTATIKLGSTASDAKYRAAATFTTADTPTFFGLAANVGEELAAEETLILTIGTAALPSSGTLRVIWVYTID